jgi:hypothetical protein
MAHNITPAVPYDIWADVTRPNADGTLWTVVDVAAPGVDPIPDLSLIAGDEDGNRVSAVVAAVYRGWVVLQPDMTSFTAARSTGGYDYAGRAAVNRESGARPAPSVSPPGRRR